MQRLTGIKRYCAPIRFSMIPIKDVKSKVAHLGIDRGHVMSEIVTLHKSDGVRCVMRSFDGIK